MTGFQAFPATTLDRLIALARESACGRRRQLLHDVTDPLFAAAPGRHGEERLAALAEMAEEEQEAFGFAARARLRRQLDARLLLRLIRDGETARAVACFAEIAGVDYEAAHGAFADPTHELLAMVCKAQGVPRAVFTMMAVLLEGEGSCTAECVARISKVYNRTPQDAAERAMRFWRLRRSAAEPSPFPPGAEESAAGSDAKRRVDPAG